MSPLELGEILVVFVSSLTADEKYPVQDCQNFPRPIQMQLSQKQKIFSQSFAPFPESNSYFKHFERKDDRHGESISEIRDCEKLVKITL